MISRAGISSSLLGLVSRLPLSSSPSFYHHRCPLRLPPSPAMTSNSPHRAALMATMAAASGHDSTTVPAAVAANRTTLADAHSYSNTPASVHSTSPSRDSTQNGLHPAPQEEAQPAAEQSQGPDDLRREQSGGEWFRLTDSCFLVLHQGDITQWHIDGTSDAIVNAANKTMLGGGGVDGAIHRAAGPDLYRACLKLNEIGKNVRCQTGGAVITDGFRLPVSKIIHTVGPVYYGREKSAPLLERSYKSVLSLANRNGLKYIAFPAISCGVYGYPYDEAADIALSTVKNNVGNLKEVHFVLFERPAWKEWLSGSKEKFVSC